MKPIFKQNTPAIFLIAGLIGVIAFFSLTYENKIRETKKSASRADLINSSQDQSLQKFSLTGFDDKGKTFWNLVGETAKIDSSQTVFLDQNVVLKLKDDTLIKTDHVRWSQEEGVLKTTAPVFVTHKDVKIQGVGAVGKPSESFVQLNRNIEMDIKPGTHLSCQGPMKIFYKDNKIIVYRKVKITDDRGVVTANRMDVFFDPNEKKIRQIVAIGNVTIERGTDTTHSQRAIYSVATGSIRLEGNPEITLHKESSKILDAPFRN